MTKRPAILAIALLTATLAAQCEKLSTLKLDTMHTDGRNLLGSSFGYIRLDQSDDMWLSHLWVRVWCRRGAAVRVNTSIALFIFFGGEPPMSQLDWKRAYPKPLTLNPAPPGHHLQSGDRGRFCTAASVTTEGISRTA